MCCFSSLPRSLTSVNDLKLLHIGIVGGCVDKTTIEDIIELGLNHDLSYDDAAFVAKVSTEMTHNFEKEEKIS